MRRILKIEHISLILLICLVGCAYAAQKNNAFYQKSEASELVEKGWKALNQKEYEKALQISDQCIELYSEKAKHINEGCDVKNLEKYGGCQLLNDTAQCFFIKAKVYSDVGKYEETRDVCNELKEHYFNAFVFDPRGWPWKPTDACNALIQNKADKIFNKR